MIYKPVYFQSLILSHIGPEHHLNKKHKGSPSTKEMVFLDTYPTQSPESGVKFGPQGGCQLHVEVPLMSTTGDKNA